MSESTPGTSTLRGHAPALVALAACLVVAVAISTTLVHDGPTTRDGSGESVAAVLNEKTSPSRALTPNLPESGSRTAAVQGVAAPLVDAVAADTAVGPPAPAQASNGSVDSAFIVRTASLELEADDVAAVLLHARTAIDGLGGYVAGSDEHDQGDGRWASVTYRVPVDHFNDAIDALRGLSTKVARESTQSQEVTATVVDLDARISNLRASEKALVEIMDRAGRIEDVLAVQARLEDVRGQIERLEAQRSDLADRAALSSISVTWYTPVAAVTVAREGWNLGAEVDAALAQTVQALQRLVSLGIWLTVVALPLTLVPFIVLIVALGLVRRRARRRGGDDGPASNVVGATPSE